MLSSIIAAVAVLATSAVAQTGSAVVINQCTYPVYLDAVPAAGGGHSESDTVLASGGSWSQPWTVLSNAAGWSIKLSKTAVLANIMQYEYTFHNDGIIWFDLSDVDGNPWNGDWEITANGNCVPRQAAYRYATDDAYGMQSCNSNSTITVTLCSGESQSDGSASSASSSMAAAKSTAAPSLTTLATKTTSTSAITTAPNTVGATDTSVVLTTAVAVSTVSTATTAVVTTKGTVSTVTASAVFTSTATQTYYQHHHWTARHAHGYHN